jgi:myo-inositol-1(or 4)-monophosphatase
LPANDDLTLLTEAARAAGEVALSFWRRTQTIWEKQDGAGPVSEADLAVNRLLEDRLRGARPDYGWLSEETPDDQSRLSARRTFIIDPIDGTRAFLDGTPDFAHSIAVAEDGVVTAAVVFLPARNSLYSASDRDASALNGRDIRCSSPPDRSGATLLTARANLAPEHWADGRPPDVKRVFRSSLAWRLCLVAEGAFDAMMTLRPTWEWDVAAGSLIAARAGATVSDGRGQVPGFNASDPRLAGLIAAPGGLHRDLMARLRV